jgi:hypothetical protein
LLLYFTTLFDFPRASAIVMCFNPVAGEILVGRNAREALYRSFVSCIRVVSELSAIEFGSSKYSNQASSQTPSPRSQTAPHGATSGDASQRTSARMTPVTL